MHIYIYIYIYVYIYIHVYTCICEYTHMQIHIFIYMSTLVGFWNKFSKEGSKCLSHYSSESEPTFEKTHLGTTANYANCATTHLLHFGVNSQKSDL